MKAISRKPLKHSSHRQAGSSRTQPRAVLTGHSQIPNRSGPPALSRVMPCSSLDPRTPAFPWNPAHLKEDDTVIESTNITKWGLPYSIPMKPSTPERGRYRRWIHQHYKMGVTIQHSHETQHTWKSTIKTLNPPTLQNRGYHTAPQWNPTHLKEYDTDVESTNITKWELLKHHTAFPWSQAHLEEDDTDTESSNITKWELLKRHAAFP